MRTAEKSVTLGSLRGLSRSFNSSPASEIVNFFERPPPRENQCMVDLAISLGSLKPILYSGRCWVKVYRCNNGVRFFVWVPRAMGLFPVVFLIIFPGRSC